MSAPQRAAAFLVAFLTVVALAVVALSGTDGLIGRAPDGTPTATSGDSASPTPTATVAPTESAAATGPDEDEILATLAEIEEQVIEIRGLPAAGIGPPDLLTRDELADELQALFDADYPEEDRVRDNFVLRAFGLLGPDEDIGELQLQLLSDQVLGFYDDRERRMVVVTEAGLNAEAKLIYAHEYTHALQYAAFDVDSLETDAVGEDDRSLARIALLEGDATVTMLAWAFEHLSQQELIEIGTGQQLPDTTGIPSWMVNQLLFPYLAGQTWVMELSAANGATPDPRKPDFSEVDAAYADPPTSTAQIIDVEKWYDRLEPVPVELPDLAEALGSDWEEVDVSPVGQASIGILLEHFGAATADANLAAEGWAGDRALVARGPDDAFALAWRLTWETDRDAEEFEAAYGNVIDQLPFPALVTRIDERDVLVAHAADADILRRTVDAAR